MYAMTPHFVELYCEGCHEKYMEFQEFDRQRREEMCERDRQVEQLFREKNILTKHTEIGGVNIISLITETIFNMVFLGEGISKSTLLYELKDFIEGTEQGENDLLFDRQNCFEITRRIILHLLPSESIENFSRKRRDLNG
jgi:hypothetical protein